MVHVSHSVCAYEEVASTIQKCRQPKLVLLVLSSGSIGEIPAIYTSIDSSLNFMVCVLLESTKFLPALGWTFSRVRPWRENLALSSAALRQ